MFGTGLKVKQFAGTYYDLGFRRGQALSETFRPPAADPEKVRLAADCERLLGHYYPPLLDELRGLLDGSGFNRDDFVAYYLARHRSVYRRRCTMFAVGPPLTREGRLLVGRNYDWVRGDLKWCELREVRLDAAPARIGYSNHWIGEPDVLTAKGLLVSLATLRPRRDAQPGLQWNAVIEIVAATCASADEAAATILRLPHIRPMNYLVADAATAYVLEAQPEGVKRRALADGLVVATNRVADEMGRAADCTRYAGAVQLLRGQAGGIDERVIKTVLADHEFHICDGDHARRDGMAWETIWSFIGDPAAMRLALAPGRPCETAYVGVDFSDGMLRVKRKT